MNYLNHLFIGALLVALPLGAGPVQELTILNGNQAYGGYFVGDLTATLGVEVIPIFCVEITQFAFLNEPYPVLEEAILPGTVYSRAAWLAEQMAGAALPVVGDLQFAIWNLLSPVEAPDTLGSAAWLAASVGHDAAGSWTLLSNLKRQDFITPGFPPGGDVQTPEPNTALGAFAGMGIIFILAGLRRRGRG